MENLKCGSTGHSLIKQRMAELKCKFGGEMSGHIFMADDLVMMMLYMSQQGLSK